MRRWLSKHRYRLMGWWQRWCDVMCAFECSYIPAPRFRFERAKLTIRINSRERHFYRSASWERECNLNGGAALRFAAQLIHVDFVILNELNGACHGLTTATNASQRTNQWICPQMPCRRTINWINWNRQWSKILIETPEQSDGHNENKRDVFAANEHSHGHGWKRSTAITRIHTQNGTRSFFLRKIQLKLK